MPEIELKLEWKTADMHEQAAELVGYFSIRHFTKLFLAHVGVNPTAYKKTFQQKTIRSEEL